jgi:hypothetical protein
MNGIGLDKRCQLNRIFGNWESGRKPIFCGTGYSGFAMVDTSG